MLSRHVVPVATTVLLSLTTEVTPCPTFVPNMYIIGYPTFKSVACEFGLLTKSGSSVNLSANG